MVDFSCAPMVNFELDYLYDDLNRENLIHSLGQINMQDLYSLSNYKIIKPNYKDIVYSQTRVKLGKNLVKPFLFQPSLEF